ncbi:MAG: response regulator transcription factor [Haloarculaceae archaeon]
MSAETQGRPTVLVVDDERDVADAYAMKLEAEYDTTVAYGGEAALAELGPHVDAVLLDRRMPDIHGDEVLERLREQGYGCTVIMVTAVDPDLNILEMEFDDYLCKPVDTDTLLTTLSQHLDVGTTDPDLEEFFALLSKLSVLEEERTPAELERDEEFQALKREAIEKAERLRETVDDFETIVETHRSVTRGSGTTL